LKERRSRRPDHAEADTAGARAVPKECIFSPRAVVEAACCKSRALVRAGGAEHGECRETVVEVVEVW